MRISLALLLLLVGQVAQQPEPPATASLEGIVVRLGTSEPIANADVELTRVEGTQRAPLPPGAAEILARALVGGGNGGPEPPAAIRSEVRYARTGADGKFSFKDLKEGKYRLVSIYIGGTYHPAEYGQRDPRGRGMNFPVTEGESVRDKRLEMAPTGTITGRVLDAAGQPMGHVSVMALEPMMQNGRRYLAIMHAGHTDERGEYRLFWLSPGRYYVAARVEDLQRRNVPMYVIPPGRGGMNERASSPVVVKRRTLTGEIVEETFGLVYSGGVLDPNQSQLIELKPGQTFGGVDIPMNAGVTRSFHIRGVVLAPTGEPAKSATVVAIPRQWNPHVFILNSTVDANGEFDLKGAVQGGYAVFATASAAGTISESLAAAAAAAGVPLASLGVPTVMTGVGHVPVEVAGANVDGLRIVTAPGLPLNGRVYIEGRPTGVADPDLARIRINLVRDPDIMMMPASAVPLPPAVPNTPPQPANGVVDAAGSFRILASPGDFRVVVNTIPPNTYVKAIRMGLTDILAGGLHLTGPPEASLEIVVGIDGAEISGSVQSDRGDAIANAVVVLVPEPLALRRRVDLYKSISTDSTGRFRLQTVPPGSYKLFSWEYVDAESWQDPQFLQPYEVFGKTVSVREGGKQEMQLTVTPVRR